MAIIEVTHLTKEYRLGQVTTVADTFKMLAGCLRGQSSRRKNVHKALDDISFTIQEGEVVGIIGPNGAGKSTLLKILSGVTRPTKGRCLVRGKVAPLIEVGAGLVGDLTGRENIYLNAAILGLSRKEIRARFDEIVEFAELAEFIDTPVKRYSSGMKIRLGFSIATNMEADIIVIDEVLAVGDLAFQRKCFDRMELIIKHEGRTVLIVSHNLRHIERLCQRALLLSDGKIKMNGNAREVCEEFYSDNNKTVYAYAQNKKHLKGRIDGSGDIDVRNVYLIDKNGMPIETILPDDPISIKVEFVVKNFIARPEIVVGLHTTDFVYLVSATNGLSGQRPDFGPGEHSVECSFYEHNLMPGVYSVRVAFLGYLGQMLWAGENLRMFRVSPGNLPVASMPQLGLIRPNSCWNYSQ